MKNIFVTLASVVETPEQQARIRDQFTHFVLDEGDTSAQLYNYLE